MKLVLIADLHFRIHWFHWLIEQAPGYDLVCFAGDLLDMFRYESRMEQAREVKGPIVGLADIVPVAICSGNHDNAGRLAAYERAPIYEWFIDLGAHPNIITDGSTQKPENLIVTTILLTQPCEGAGPALTICGWPASGMKERGQSTDLLPDPFSYAQRIVLDVGAGPGSRSGAGNAGLTRLPGADR
jgi:hypothetical protein